MWFIFPIAAGLGKSDMSQYYGLDGPEEVIAFIDHPVLGANYRRCIRAMLKQSDTTALTILGRKEVWKFQASITLFMKFTDDEILKKDLKKCLKTFYFNNLCKSTTTLLSSQSFQ